MTKIKICGLMRPSDAELVNILHPDFAGMIFAPHRTRTITHETAERIRETLSRDIPAVGVFINAEISEICALERAGIIQMIQLHGSENDAYIEELRRVTALPVIQAFRVTCEKDLERAMSSRADHVLLDSGIGGTGETFDWSVIGKTQRPYILAGGLNPENVAEAVRRLAPYAVDVSSGVESNGKKDFEKMKRFVRNVREADASHKKGGFA